MTFNIFGPHIKADAHVNPDGNLEKVVIHNPKAQDRNITIPGDWLEGVPPTEEGIREAVSGSLNGAKVSIVRD